MPTFPSKPYTPSKTSSTFNARIRRYPALLFGLPFILTIVGGSFAMAQFTSVRYESHDRKVSQVTKEGKLKLDKDRHKVSLQEEYFRLQAKGDELDSYENKRIERPKGVADNLMKG